MISTRLELFLFLLPALLGGYAYFLYPALLRVWGTFRPARAPLADPPVDSVVEVYLQTSPPVPGCLVITEDPSAWISASGKPG